MESDIMSTNDKINVGDKIKIDVTEADIASGERGSACDCPIAIAIRRATGCSRVYVSYDWPRFTFAGKIYDISFENTKAYDFVSAFDNGHLVQPFSFELTISKISDLRPLFDP